MVIAWHSAPLGMSGHGRHHRWMREGLNGEGESDDHDGFGKEQFDWELLDLGRNKFARLPRKT